MIAGKMTGFYTSTVDKRKETVEAHKSNKWSNQYGKGLSLNNCLKNDKTLLQ